MAGDYAVSVEGKRVGRVMRFDAHKTRERWVGFALRDKSGEENTAKFPTRRAATEWVVAEAQRLGALDP